MGPDRELGKNEINQIKQLRRKRGKRKEEWSSGGYCEDRKMEEEKKVGRRVVKGKMCITKSRSDTGAFGEKYGVAQPIS